MIRAAATALVLATAAPAAAAERLLALPGFDRVRVEGPVTVTATTGAGTSVAVDGDPAALAAFEARVDGRLLVLSARERPVAVRLRTGALDGAAIAGSARLSVDRMRGPRIRLSVQGAAELVVERVEADRLDLTAAGGARVRLGGRAAEARVSALGGADVDMAQLETDALTVSSQGAGAITAQASRTARINASGAGAVLVQGAAQCTVTGSGAGRVNCGDQ